MFRHPPFFGNELNCAKVFILRFPSALFSLTDRNLIIMKTPSPSYSRRHFLKSSAAVGTFTILPSYLALGQKSQSGILPPSERVNLAVIGIGNQGHADRNRMVASGLCTVVALCDVDLQGKHTLPARYAHQVTPLPPLDPESGETPPEVYSKARTFTDFRKMFEVMGDEDEYMAAPPCDSTSEGGSASHDPTEPTEKEAATIHRAYDAPNASTDNITDAIWNKISTNPFDKLDHSEVT